MSAYLKWYDKLVLGFVISVETVLILSGFAVAIEGGVTAAIFGVTGIIVLYKFLHKDLSPIKKILGSIGLLFLTVLAQMGFHFLIQFLSR